jgi:transposase-like protein
MFTDLQVQRYVKHPFHCPFCSSIDIEGWGDFSSEESFVFQTVSCHSCQELFVETYVIEHVEVAGQALKEPTE